MSMLACGGRVETSSKDPGESSTTGDPMAATSSSASSDPGIDNPDADTELGVCKLGPLEFAKPDEPCAWVVDHRCYASHDMACNCACPRSRNSQCVSGFDAGPNGHVGVLCN